MRTFVAAALSSLVIGASAFTPYTPGAGWTYHLEAARKQGWPACGYRFMAADSRDSQVALGDSANAGAEFELVAANADGNSGSDTFYLKLSSGKYLSNAGADKCGQLQVDTYSGRAGANQEFRFVKPDAASSAPFEWRLQAVARAACTGADTVTFSYTDCGTRALAMGGGSSSGGGDGGGSTFFLHAVRGGAAAYDKKANTKNGCADPFAWYSAPRRAFQLACTGGNLPLYSSGGSAASGAMAFSQYGSALGGSIPSWASSGNRWAPETLEFTDKGKPHNVLFFSDSTGRGGTHRVGWAMSAAAAGDTLASSWREYSNGPLDLGNSAGGEIDQHIFRDAAHAGNRTYVPLARD